MRAGLVVSTIAHAALIALIVIGVGFTTPLEPTPVESIAVDLISIEEFSNPDDAVEGHEIYVFLEAYENRDGFPVISKRKADFQLAWDKIHFFWGDERHVPPEHPDSNYRMAKEAMVKKVPIPPENVHRIKSENPNAHQAAEEYEEMLRAFFRLKAGEFPCFALVLLGMGSDGHAASLFPGTEALQEQRHLVVANWVEKFQAYRITMTMPVFNHATFVLFLVSGEEKAETLRLVLEGEGQKDLFPAQLIRPSEGRLLWLVDQGAGRLLNKANTPIELKK